MNFFSKQLTQYQEAFKAIGFDPKALDEDPEALATFIEDAKATAVQEATEEAMNEIATAAELTATAVKEKKAAAERMQKLAAVTSSYEAGFAAAGLKLESELIDGLTHESTEDDVKAAAAEVTEKVAAKISIQAAEQLAASGHTKPVAEVPSTDPSKAKPTPTNLTGLARTVAALK